MVFRPARAAPSPPGPSAGALEIVAGRGHDPPNDNDNPRGDDMTRTIAVLGAANTGKSTLVDAMAALEGEPQPAAGPGELRVVGFDHLGDRWQAIDTPGSVEFLHLAADALLAADVAVVCVAPTPEGALLAAPYLQVVEAAGTPALLFINRIDEAEGRVRDVVAALQDYVRHPILLRQIPIRADGHVVGAVDLVSERAWSYREHAPSKLVALPEGLVAREHEARGDLLDHLADFDDALLEQIVEDRAPASEDLFALCARVLGENRVMEALIGSGLHGNGIIRLLKALRHEAPGPEALRARLAAQAGQAGAPLAVVFGGTYRRHMGKVLLLRALADLPAGRPLGGRAPGQLLPADPRDTRHLDGVAAGEIVTAVKADHLTPARLAGEEALAAVPGWHRAAEPSLSRILLPAVERDGVKLSGALATLAEGDGGLTVAPDPATGAPLVGTQGSQHLRLVKARLKEAFGLEVEEQVPSPAWRETVAGRHEVAFRHKKQTGGAGQFADVKLTVAAAPRGSGFSFTEVVKGGAVPRNYIPAVEAGVREALGKGPLGFPVVDIAVTLTDGLHHPVDSSDMAFRIAGRRAVAEGLKAAGPVLLQPVFRVAIHAPSVFTGALGPIVSAHHGQVQGFDADPEAKGWDLFQALVPGAALPGLANDIRAATQGVGRHEAAFDHYEELHGKAADRVVQEAGVREPA